MKISLITTVKNESASVGDLVESIAAQSRQADEWIVVDGGSQDDTIASFAHSSARVLSRHRNIAGGRNTAIEHAVGDIIAVTDAGCRPRRDWLARLVEPIESGRCTIAAGTTEPRIRTWFDAVQWTLLDQFVMRGWSLRRAALSSRSLAFLRSEWRECSYPEWLDTGEDTWLFAEWRRRARRIAVVEDAVVEWQLRPDWRSFALQHFAYMRGDGRANLHPRRHAARFGFYALLTTGCVFGLGQPPLLALAAIAWLAYLAATSGRLAVSTRYRDLRFKLAVLAVLPAALLTMDLAKMTGYAAGRLERGTSRWRASV